jgi:hypothetical protein
MRYLILVCVLGLAIAVEVAVLIAASDDSFASFDLHHPATLLPILAGRLHAFRPAARKFVRALVDEFTAPYRERLGHESPTQSLP